MRFYSLLYHDVVAPGQFAGSGFSGADADVYKLEEPTFRSHLESIALAHRPGPVAVIRSRQTPPTEGSILLTFDDGGCGAIPATADLLEAHGWQGHFFITTDYIGNPTFLSAAQIRELRDRGHAIGSHSCSHPIRMGACPWPQLQREWRDSISKLTDILGEPVRIASVPGGYYSRAVALAAMEAGVEVLFNSEPVSKVRSEKDCLVIGRYSIQRQTPAATAAAIASGALSPRLTQYLYWNAKKLVKRAGGEHWLAFRRVILAKREALR